MRQKAYEQISFDMVQGPEKDNFLRLQEMVKSWENLTPEEVDARAQELAKEDP
jgi:uncharacterized protein YfkK (UPF0435 family)